MVAVLSLAALAVLALRLPRTIPAPAPASLSARLAVARLPGVLPALGTTLAWGTGAYLVYTYVSPLLAMAAGLGEGRGGWLLFLLGLSARAGIAASGAATDRFGSVVVLVTVLPGLAGTFIGLTVAAPAVRPAMVPLFVSWGSAPWGFIPARHRLMEFAGLPATPVVLSLNSSAMSLGFSLGAAAGSLVIAVTSIAWIGAAGAVREMAALATMHRARQRDAARTARVRGSNAQSYEEK